VALIESKYDPAFRFKVVGSLGSGTYGEVLKVVDDDGQQYALKRFTEEDVTQEAHETSINECVCLRQLPPHPNIIRPVAMAVEQFACMLLLPLFEGDLSRLLTQEAVRVEAATGRVVDEQLVPAVGLEPALIRSLMRQLLDALVHLEANRRCHCDVKPANVLFNIIKRDSATGAPVQVDIRLADFGLSYAYAPVPDAVSAYPLHVQTLWYRAPEVLLNTHQFGPAIDVWSLGCLLAELATGAALFPGRCSYDQLLRIFRQMGTPNEQAWPGCNQLLRDLRNEALWPQWPGATQSEWLERFQPALGEQGTELLRRMLTYDPTRRISVREARAHAWLQEDATVATPAVVKEHMADGPVSAMPLEQLPSIPPSPHVPMEE
jgi:serine/threonine protein kinase